MPSTTIPDCALAQGTMPSSAAQTPTTSAPKPPDGTNRAMATSPPRTGCWDRMLIEEREPWGAIWPRPSQAPAGDSRAARLGKSMLGLASPSASAAMVAMSEEVRRRWEVERERREVAELVEMARVLLILLGDQSVG